MSKISIYDVVPVPKLADKLIGTSVGGDPEDLTYNFTLGELLNLFIPNIPGNTLQGVLDFGNTATQNINLTGIITTTTLNVGSTANILNSNLTGQTKITGGLFDRLNSIGTAGQVLTSTGTQVQWYTIPTIIPNLQQVLTAGNTAVNNIILTGNLTANNAALLTATISTSLTLLGTVKDGLSSVGTNNQVLSSNVTGVRWINLPVYSATSPLLYNSGTGVFSIQQANASQSGYLSSADWITFDGKQTAIILTTTGNSGPSTLIGSTINVPNYTLAGLNGVPQTRTLTINGITYNLSADRSWTISAGVSSVTASSPLFSTGGATPNITIQQSSSTLDGYLSSVDWVTFNSKQALLGGTGLVKSVGGTISYITDNSANWNTAYNDSIVSAAVTGTATKLLTLNQQDGGTITASWSDIDTGLTSVGVSMPTAFTVTNSPLTSNGTIAITGSGNGLQYIDGTGALQTFPSLTGFVPYTGATGSVNLGVYSLTATSLIKNGGTSGQFLKADGSVDSSAYIVLGSLSASAPLSYNNLTGAFSISQSGAAVDGYLSSTDWNTFNNKQVAGNYITSLTGEATALGPGAAAVTLDNAAVISKVLTGLNVTGGTVVAADSILTGFGKVQNQINGLIGGTIFQGTWNANTNTPALVSSVGTNGHYYIVSVAGTTNLDGITDWQVGDWAIFAGTTWEKVDNTDSVSSVNGFTGAVSLTTDNIPEGATNLYFTNTRARTAISLTTTGSSGASTYDNTTGVFNIPTYTDQFVGTVTSVAALTLGTSGTDLSSTVANSTTTPVITLNVPTASAVNRGALSSADWTTFDSKQPAGNYVTTDTTQTITALKTILRGGDVLNFKIGVDTLYGLKIAYNQNELVPSGEATWSFVNTFNNGIGTGLQTTPISFFRGVLVTGERLLSVSVNANLLDYYGNNPSGRYPIYAYNTGVQQFASSIIVGETAGVVNPATGAIADLPAGVVANFKGRVIGSNAVNSNEFITLSQATSISRLAISLTTTGSSGPATYNNTTGVFNIPEYAGTVNPSAREIQTYVATSGQTVFTVTGGYTVGLVDVYINGVRLTSSDFTATNGTTVVLTVGTIVGNIVDIIKYTSGIVNSISGTGTTNELAYFTASTTISSLTTATYPSLTELSYVKGVTSSIQTQLNGKQAAGTYVTSVTGTSPIVSSGGTTPAISIPVATTSVNGYLSSTDWSTFNSKQNALTNPVTGTGTSGQVAFFTGTSAISSESNLFWDATNDRLGIGTATPSNPLHIVSNTLSQLNIQALSGNTNAQINLEPTGTGIALIGPANPVSLSFRTDASIKMSITSGGNVLIGNPPATDNGARLQVSGTATFSSSLTTGGQTSVLYNGYDSNVEGLRLGFDTSYYNAISATFSSSAANNKMNFVVNSGNGTRAIGMTLQGNGSVGIGTTTPDVTGFGWRTLTIRGGTTSGEAGVLELQSPTTTGAANLGIIAFMDGSNRNAQIGVQRDSSTTTSNMFFYTNGGSGIVERLKIASNGVSTFSGAGDDIVIIGKATASQNSYLQLNAGSAANAYINSIGSGRLILGANGAASNHLAITSGGNVLIGTTTDSGGKLRVEGDVFINNSSNAQIGLNTTGALNSVGAYLYFNRSGSNKWTAGMGPYTGGNNYEIATGSVVALSLAVTTGAATFDTSAAISASFNSTNASGGYIGFRRSGTSIGYLGNSAQLGQGVLNALELRADNNMFLTTTSGLFTMLSTGNVGINTASPVLENGGGQVIYNSTVPRLAFRNSTSGTTAFDGTDLALVSSNFYVFNRESGEIIFGTSGAERMRITSGGELRVTASDVGVALYQSLGNGEIAAYNWGVGGGWIPLVHGGSQHIFNTSGAERMRITSGGNVGIGTSTTTGLLTLGRAGGGQYIAARDNTTGYEIGYLQFNSDNITLNPQGGVSGNNSYIRLLTAGTERMQITSGGNVLIGTTTDAGHKLLVNGTARFDNPNGITVASSTQFRQIYFDGFSNLYFWNGSNQSLLTSAGVWQNASDVSIKKEITDIKYGLSDLMLLNPRSYKMKTDDLEQIGFIAQEVEKIIPEVVSSDNKGMKGLSYGNMVSLLVKAIQELKAELDELKSKN